MNYFDVHMPEKEINAISTLGIAHIGDAVFELMVRTHLCLTGHKDVTVLHNLTVTYVKAGAQAKAAARIMPFLTEEEQAVYRRGRNRKVNSVPHSATVGEYHAATGLETLFGWLYLKGERNRLNEIFDLIIGE